MERPADRADRLLRPVDRNHTALPVVERPHVVQAHNVVGVRVREQNRVHARDPRAQGLIAKVWRGVDQHAVITILDVNRRPKALVPRILRMAYGAAAADHRHPDAGARSEHRNANGLRGHLKSWPALPSSALPMPAWALPIPGLLSFPGSPSPGQNGIATPLVCSLPGAALPWSHCRASCPAASR